MKRPLLPCPPVPLRRTRRVLLGAGLALLAAGPGWAQSSPYYVAGSLAVNHDSNLFRLAGDQVPGPDETRADTITSTALVAGVNQGIGRQRVVGSLTLRDNRFARNDRYDNQSYNGQLGLDWSTVERISGSLSISAARALSTFNAEGVGLLLQKNLETTQAANAVVRLGLVTAYSLEVSAGQRRIRNSLDQELIRARDFNQDSASLGLAWRPGGALSVVVALRELKGEYPTFRRDAAGNAEADRFKQQQVDLLTTWQVSGASGLDLRLNFGDTTYVSNDGRNFSSVNGSLGWLWQATGKLRFNTRYTRDKGQDAYPSTKEVSIGTIRVQVPVTLFDQRSIDTWRIQGDLEVSAKVGLSAGLQLASRQIDRLTVPRSALLSEATSEGRDRTTLLTLGARWSPTRSALLGCDAGHEKRSASGALTAPLKGSTFSCFGQITLQ